MGVKGKGKIARKSASSNNNKDETTSPSENSMFEAVIVEESERISKARKCRINLVWKMKKVRRLPEIIRKRVIEKHFLQVIKT